MPQTQPLKCPQCGEPVLATDSHCMGCGRALRTAPAAAPAPPVAKPAARPPKGDQEMARRHAATLDKMHSTGLVLRGVLVVMVLGLLTAGYFGYGAIQHGIRVAHGESCSASVKANEACRIPLTNLYVSDRPLMPGAVLLGIPEGAIAQDDRITLARLENPFKDRLTLASGALTLEARALGAASVTAETDQPPQKPLELTVELDPSESDNLADLTVLLVRKEREGEYEASTDPKRVETSILRWRYGHDKNMRVDPDPKPTEDTPTWLQWSITDWGHYYIYRPIVTIDSTKYPPWKSS